MAWGSEPSKQVRLDTKMVSLFFETLKRQFDPKTLSVTFPKMIESLIELGSDQNWEVWRSNQIQQCKIQYQANIATKKIGLILIHTHCESLHSHLVGEERLEVLKEIYIQLALHKLMATAKDQEALDELEKNLKQKRNEIAAKFDCLSQEELDKQDKLIMEDKVYDDALTRGGYAK